MNRLHFFKNRFELTMKLYYILFAISMIAKITIIFLLFELVKSGKITFYELIAMMLIAILFTNGGK